MSEYKKYAMHEFEAAGWVTADGTWDDEMQKHMCEQVLELLDLLSEHGHSGSSAPYAIRLFQKLAAFEPITPLTGEDSEWNLCGETLFQNRRCGHVFRDSTRFGGQAYDAERRIFRRPDGHCYTNYKSAVPIVFPYVPGTEYVDSAE